MAVKRSRQNLGRRPAYNDDGVTFMASKMQRRKGRYLGRFVAWTSRHKSTRTDANRRERHAVKQGLHQRLDEDVE